jgi:hypothetical protein
MWSKKPIPELTEMVCEAEACVAWPAISVPGVEREATSPPSMDSEMSILVSFVEREMTAVRRGVEEDIFAN